MPLAEQLQIDIVTAMKAKDTIRLIALRAIRQGLDKVVKEKGNATPADETKILEGMVKRHQDSITQFEAGNRQDLADKEKAELAVVRTYLPADATSEEIDAFVAAAIYELQTASAEPLTTKSMGTVMKAVQAKLVGKRADGKVLSDKIKAALA